MQKLNKLSAFWQAAIFILIPATTTQAAPPPSNYHYNDQQSIAIREMRDSIESVKHSVRNQESEIRTFEEKLANLDSIIESVRDEISDTSKSHKDQLKGSASALESKLTSLETSVKGILSDLKQFQAYSTESSTTLSQYKKKITDLEKAIELQNQNIDDLQVAMRALTDALHIKTPAPQIAVKPAPIPAAAIPPTSPNETLYKVKEGDSLEKIARAHQTSVKAIKEINNLANDKIIVGKNLKIPSPE